MMSNIKLIGLLLTTITILNTSFITLNADMNGYFKSEQKMQWKILKLYIVAYTPHGLCLLMFEKGNHILFGDISKLIGDAVYFHG